jgi:hypothetical protein
MSLGIICAAIKAKHLIQFNNTGDEAHGPRLVEPHMVAYTTADNLVLSAWFLGGESESKEGQGWREYLLSEMQNVTVLTQTFAGPRYGYKPTGGQRFHNVQCRL